MPMYGTGYIFSKKFFTSWVVVGIMWLMGSLFCVGVFLVWEGRMYLTSNLKAIYLYVSGKKHPSKFHRQEAIYVEGMEMGSEMPPEGREKEMEEKEMVSNRKLLNMVVHGERPEVAKFALKV
jgi:hypothetical protein